ncbi:MAG TPA: NfeD family protein, partial [Kiritimatiellia bacterium]
KEKQVSFVAGMMRSSAQRKGHDPQLAEKMVRMETEYRIGEEIIAPSNQLLTLTNLEAERLVGTNEVKQPLLSRGTVKDIPELLAKIGLEGARTVELQVTDAERVARWIAALAPLFLMAGLLGIYVEVKTPGFGLPGILGAMFLALFFWGHHIAGLAGAEEMLLFLLGAVLILLELFLFPGTAILGVLGASLILWALLASMIGHFPGEPSMPTLPDLTRPLANLLGAIIGTGVVAALIARILPKARFFSPMVLATATSRDKGFASWAPEDNLVGQEGVTATQLHPGGAAIFGEQRLDVVTRGEFIQSGKRIVVVEVHGMRIVVEAIKSGGST